MSLKDNNRLLHWKNQTSTSDANLSNPNGNTQLHLRKETDFSSKLLGKESYLDYTFLSTRSSLNPQAKDKKFKEYIHDLHKTLDLNIELITKLISDWKDADERKELAQLFNTIILQYNNKNKKRKLLNQKESKMLIERQIISEVKRKIEENNRYHTEKFKEVDENLDSKEEYIKIFEKKLQEVEIYIAKATKNSVNSPYEKYKGWKMNDFLEVNNKATRLRFLLQKEIDKVKFSINEVNQENMTYKDEDPSEKESIIVKENEENNQKRNEKVKSYMNYYKNQIRVLQMRMKLLRSCFNNMSHTMSYLRFDKEQINQRKSSLTKEDELNKTANFGNEEQTDHQVKRVPNNANKSILNLDMTRKINNLMDFSIVLNKRGGDETKYEDLGKTGVGGLGNVTNLNMWDISCINKN